MNDRETRMHPIILGMPAYFLFWIVAAAMALLGGGAVAWRAGFPLGRSIAALLMLSVTVLVGSKLLYLAEARWFPADDYVPATNRGLTHGFRIPGGIALLALTLPLWTRLLALPWRPFGDRVIPFAALGLIAVRFGCWLNGCCFGRVSEAPWAVHFPRNSWVHWYHREHYALSTAALESLPVHPLQLYFLAASLGTLCVLTWYVRRGPPPGSVQILFFILFFGTTALLEPLRENQLTLNNGLAPVFTALATAAWIGARGVPFVSAAKGARV